ncbi:MAG: LTA synthase family protein [Bacteroidales bacterium]
MKPIIVQFFKYYFFWLLYFTVFKLLLLAYNWQLAQDLPFSDLWGIFKHGVIMDLSASGYFSILPGVVMSLGFLFTSQFCSYFLKYYTLLMLIILTFLGLSDIGLYPAWGSRLNAQFLMYLETPGGIYASLSWWQLLLFLSLWIGIVWLGMWMYNRLLPMQKMIKIRTKWYTALMLLILSGALIVPIRGGLNRSPLNHSSVYFSKHLVANQFAYNYFWNFMHSVLKSKNNSIKLDYMNIKEAENILKEHDKTNLQAPQIIDTLATKPINIVLVMLESFSNKIIEPLGGMPDITPCLNSFCHEGIAFKNFYSTGNRSDKGMSALIGGRPSDMNKLTALVFPDKMSKLDYFPKYFADKGYSMSFFYGGDVNFYNTRAVMLQSGIEKIVSKSDFSLEIGLKQKWGVPDNYLYDRLLEDLKQEKEPFFSMVYNISSHEPFDIPEYKKIEGNSNEKKYLNAASYSDSCLGAFINSLKEAPFWDNTLVIITADHTSIEPGPSNITEPATYRIPLIFIGGVIKPHPINERFGNQNDLAPMLLKQLGWQHKPDLLSKDFLIDDSYAFYFRSEGWGYMCPQMGWFMNTDTKSQDFFYNNTPSKTDSVVNFAKAYVQYLHDAPLDEM